MSASVTWRTGSRRLSALVLAVLAVVVVGPLGPSDATLAARVDAIDTPDPRVASQAVERRVALGISTPFGERIRKLKRFTESIGGHAPATWTIWSRWGDKETRSFPTELVEKVHALGVTPMIWWEPLQPGRPDRAWYPRYVNTIAGGHDAYIRRFARRARAFGRTVLLRYAPEANSAYHAWGVGRFDNTPRTFLAAWRHVWDIFLEEGASNVKFVWSVARQSCRGCNPYVDYYPGDEYVDYAAFSAFNWGDTRVGWRTMLEGFERVVRHLTSISARPLMAVEVGSSAEGGDKAAWIREGYPAVYEAHPEVVAIVYLNADLRRSGHPDWRLASPPRALVAYAEIAAMPEFSGRIRKRSGGSIADALAAAPAAPG